MKNFKRGYLIAMSAVFVIAGYVCAATDAWQHNAKGHVMICVAGIITGFAVYYLLLLKKKEQECREDEAKKLLLQQKRYRLVLDNSDEMMYEIGIREESNIISERVHEKFGWNIPSQCRNLNAEEMMKIWHVCQEDEAQVRLLYDRITKQGRSGRIVVRMQKINGDYIWCTVTGFPLYDSDQQLISIVGKIEDVDRETKLRKKLEWENRTDCMTGLINKSTFANEAIYYLRHHSSVNTAMIFIDMDHFKEVNDTMGHSMGDHVICDMAQKLQIIFANFDLVARFGGDEFCIFVKDIPYETLKNKLEWTVDKLRSTYTNGTEYVDITASIGAAYCSQEDADYQFLLDMADVAVYEAKKKGRDQYIIKNIMTNMTFMEQNKQIYIN